MTERSLGSPDPAEPSPAGAVVDFPAMAAELSAARRTDALVDALAARRIAGSDDPAMRMLLALIRDVDELVPVLHGPAAHDLEPAADDDPAGDRSVPPAGPRRRGPRTIVALGVAGAVLAGSGVAAAGGTTGQPAPQAMGPVEEAHQSVPKTTDATKAVAPRAEVPVRSVPDAPSSQDRTAPSEPEKEVRKPPRIRVRHRIAALPDGYRPRRYTIDGRDPSPQMQELIRTQRRLEELRRRSQQRPCP